MATGAGERLPWLLEGHAVIGCSDLTWWQQTLKHSPWQPELSQAKKKPFHDISYHSIQLIHV